MAGDRLMRDPLLPQILLAAALGLALSYSAGRAAVVIMVVTAVAVALIPLSGLSEDWVFTGAWMSVAVMAASVHLPDAWRLRAEPWLSRGMALWAGVWAGLLSHLAVAPASLGFALPFLGLAWAGVWLVGRGWGIAVKVAASWLIAVAVLQVGLGFVPTPGYEGDHLE